MNNFDFLQDLERNHVLEDLIASQQAADRNQQMDIGYRQQTPGYPEYAAQARADIAPTPLDAVALMGVPFLSDAAGFASDANALATDPDPAWWQYALTGAGLLPGIPAGMGITKGTKEALAEVPGFKQSWRHMTPEERDLVDSGRARQAAETIQDVQRQYASPPEMATVAKSGGAKRGWYENSADAIDKVFGPEGPEVMAGLGITNEADASRFVRGLAAMSPQTSVESNLRNWTNTWNAWNAAGRPTDQATILRLMGESVEGDKGIGSVLDAWRKNTYRALSTPDQDIRELILSGPKVNSFATNLDPNLPFGQRMNEVTNDAWMANYGLIDQNLFSGAQRAAVSDPFGNPGLKGPGYIGASVAARKAGELADMHPAEIQETIWSWAKTLKEKAEGEGMTPSAYLKAGLLSDADIGATPSFDQLFSSGEFSDLLRAGGYGPRLDQLNPNPYSTLSDPYSRVGIDPAQDLNQSREGRHMMSAAGRLDRLMDRRGAEAALRSQLGETEEAMGLGPIRSGAWQDVARLENRRRQELLREMRRSPNLRMTPKERREFGLDR